ncbi:MAG: aspartate dehydrogenase [Clostridiales bacterium]|nr:aspartate dehydrogenase [Clostridiales bacterium]
MKEVLPFDPEKQEAVIRCSVCTGEQVAGFRDRTDGHFTEVMLLKTPEDEERFRKMFGLGSVRKIY